MRMNYVIEPLWRGKNMNVTLETGVTLFHSGCRLILATDKGKSFNYESKRFAELGLGLNDAKLITNIIPKIQVSLKGGRGHNARSSRELMKKSLKILRPKGGT